MFKQEKKVTVELIKEAEEKNTKRKNIFTSDGMSNPIDNFSDTNNLSKMVTDILDKELPMFKHNSLLHDLVLYSIIEKMKTVQTVRNVLSYIKENHAKKVQDVCFRNGEVCIKCSI